MLLIYRSKSLGKYLSNGVLHAPQNFKITIVKQKRKICNRLVVEDQGGQNNRNEKTIAVLFRNVFYYCSEPVSYMLTSAGVPLLIKLGYILL